MCAVVVVAIHRIVELLSMKEKMGKRRGEEGMIDKLSEEKRQVFVCSVLKAPPTEETVVAARRRRRTEGQTGCLLTAIVRAEGVVAATGRLEAAAAAGTTTATTRVVLLDDQLAIVITGECKVVEDLANSIHDSKSEVKREMV